MQHFVTNVPMMESTRVQQIAVQKTALHSTSRSQTNCIAACYDDAYFQRKNEHNLLDERY